jgi:uncharacterized protein with FMN-binding domain
MPDFRLVLAAVLLALALPAPPAAGADEARPSLKAELARLRIPPEWFDSTPIDWDMRRPWKEGRLEIRRLLEFADEPHNRQAVKLTLLYARKNDVDDGHELPMYLFLSGNYAWATIEYPRLLARIRGKGGTHAYLAYASCLAHFAEYDQAIAVLEQALRDLPPAPWQINSLASIHNHYGDLYAQMKQVDKAKSHYAEAIRLYPTSNQPHGRHLLPRRIAQIQTKLNLLMMQSLGSARLRDGTFTGRSMGYSDKKDMVITVRIEDGRIADVRVQHEEKIELNATRIIPQRIIEKQSLNVDAITGATVTTHAIVDGAFEALKQAGLK